MELKFETRPCRYLRSVLREIQNLEQTQELRLTDGMPDIGRVLCAWGQVLLRGKEWRGDGMSASGGVMVWVLYAPENGSAPQCVDAWLPFQGKWSFQMTDREGIIRMMPLLRSVDARTVSARKIMIRAGVGIMGEALVPFDTRISVPGELPEGVQVLRNTYPMHLPREAGEKTFLLDEEYTLTTSGQMAEEIIRYELCPQLADCKVMAGKLVFRGTGQAHILYRNQNGEFISRDLEIPFSQFTELDEDFGQDADAAIDMAVTSLEVDLTDEGSLRLKCGLVAQYVVSDRVLLELGEDAYSLRRDVTPHFQELCLPAILDQRREVAAAELSLDDGCSRIVDVCFMPDHPRMTRIGETVTGELSCLWQILYEDTNGMIQSVTRRWEQNMGVDVSNDAALLLTVGIDGIPVISASGEGANVKENVILNIRAEAEQGQTMIDSLDVGEEKKPDPNRPSLILRRTEGERLWDISKACGTTVQSICQANGLTDEPESGRMLLIPVI